MGIHVLYTGIYAKFMCAALEFSSIQGVVKPMGSRAWVTCLLPTRFSLIGLGFKGLEIAL